MAISRKVIERAVALRGAGCKTIALIGAVAFALAAALSCGSVSGASTAAAGAAPQISPIQQQTYEGMIADSRCGAKHSAAIGKTASDCTRACVHSGEQFVLVDGETIYFLEGDTMALKRVAGQRVKLVGALNGSKISVTSIVTI